MIWADRVAIVLACLTVPFVAIDHHLTPAIVFWVAAAPWLFLRSLDWVFCGEIRHGLQKRY